MAAEIENSEVEQLENKIKELQKEIEDNKVALENSQSEKETLEKKIEELEKELDNLQKELNANKVDQEKIKELEQSIADKNAEIAQKEKALKNIQKEKEQLANQNTELNNSLNQKDEKIKELEEKLKNAEGTDVTELENQLDELKAEKETLENEKKQVEDQLAAKEKELAKANEDKDNLQKQLAEKEGELAKANEDLEALQKQLDELKEQNQQLKDEKQVLQDAAKADKETIEKKKDTIADLENKIADLNQKMKELQEKENDNEQLKDQLAQLQEEKDKLEQQVKNLQNEKETAEQTLQEKNNKIEKLEEQLEDQQALKDELEKAKKELEELKNVKQQLDKKTAQLEEKETALQQAQEELEKAQEDKQASDNKVKELEEKVKQLTAERDKVNSEKDTLQQQVDKLTSANDSLNTQVKQLEKKKEELEQQLQEKEEKLTNQVVEHEKAVKEFEDKIAKLEGELESLKNQAKNDKETIENLQNQLNTANTEKDDLKSKLEEFQGNMAEALKNAQKTLNQAKEIAKNYPKDEDVQAALGKANALEDDATLSDVQEVNKKLLEAIKQAQENEAQKDAEKEQQALENAKKELGKLKDQANDIKDKNKELQGALDEAEKLSDNATLEELEKVIQDLQNALEKAKNEEQEKNEQERLEQAKKSLDLAKGLAALYPEDDKVQTALTEAKELDETATVEELNKATDQLLSSINEAEKNKQLQSKNELLDAIETAKNQADPYKEDEEVKKALEKAEAASKDKSMKELHDILDDLRTATEAAQQKKEQAAKNAEKEKALQALHDAANLLAEYADDQEVLDALENVAKLDENSSLEDINAKKDKLLGLLAEAVKQSKLATDEQKSSMNAAIEELEQLLENEFLAPSVKPSEDTINEWKEQLKKDELLLADYEKVVNEVEQAKNEVTDNIATNKENYNEAKTAVDGAEELAKSLQDETNDERIKSLLVGLLEEIGIAKSAIDRMTDELPHKAELERELGEVVANISDKAVDYVDGNLTPDLLDQAKDLVDLMPEGEKKKELKDKLQQLEKIVDQVNEVLEALNNAQKNPSDETIQDAQNKINELKELDTKYVTEEDIAALQNQLDLVKVAHEKEKMADKLNNAKDLLLKTPVGENGENFFDTEVYVTEQEKNALQDAIQKVENAHTKDALDEAKNALENALKPYTDEKQQKNGKRNEAVEQATAAVEKAESSKRQADVDEARELVNKINEETHKDEKDKLNNRLDTIKVKDITLENLKEVLEQAKEAKTTNESQKEDYPEGVWNALEQAITKGDSVVEAAGDTAEETMTSDDITNATEALEKALEALVIPVQLPSQTMINKAEFNLEPQIKLESDRLTDNEYKAQYHKTTGGLLSLNLGIVDLGLLSSGQISKISENDKHEIKVEPNTVFTGKVRVSMSGVLGGQQVKVHTFKELPNGDYKKIATRAGGVGTLLGIPIPTYIDVGMLEEGKYILLLEPSAGISLAAGIPFDIREAMIYDYTHSAEDAKVAGNFFEKEGATKGQDEDFSIIEAVTGGIHENLTHPLAINGETEIQGKYGKLYVKRDGTYRYAPESKRQNIGQYEEFKIHAKNTKNGTSDEGTLRILLDHDTIEWADNNKESKIVEAADDKKQTTIQVNPVKNVVTAAPSDQRTSRVEDHTFRSNEFTVQDTDSELTFELSKDRSGGKMAMGVKVVNVDTGEVAHEWEESIINNDWNESPDYRVTGLPKGTYRVEAKASIEGNTPRVYIRNIEVVSTSWGEYSLPYSGAKEVSGNLRSIEGNYLGADEKQHDKTLLYVKGYDVMVDDALRYLTFEVDDRGHFVRDKQGEIAKHVDRVLHKDETSDNAMYLQAGDVKAFKRIEMNIRNKRESELTVLAGDYGVLEIETNGDYTYKPYNRIESVGQTEVFEYMLVHPSGNTATAKLEITIGELDQSTENNDLILKQQQQVEFTTGKGSDTLIYQVFDDEDNLAGHEHSTWVDFTYGGVDTVEDADRIDLRAMFKAKDLNEKTVANYLKVKHEDEGITIQIDRDGLGKDYETADLITLKGEFDQKITIEDLIKNGQIILP